MEAPAISAKIEDDEDRRSADEDQKSAINDRRSGNKVSWSKGTSTLMLGLLDSEGERRTRTIRKEGH
ncbi:hypothetical protein TorRG33x02_115390 [Trema orientale]|uniref:Uncharacterized protein n=1 Tax=Trema orientale TaxID=63057 RepID=A0A2P5F4L0_TREOI|nr:hypothetical protein TorRG33x02_115390 [Trema orientale]